jgi:hypothetical protein
MKFLKSLFVILVFISFSNVAYSAEKAADKTKKAPQKVENKNCLDCCKKKATDPCRKKMKCNCSETAKADKKRNDSVSPAENDEIPDDLGDDEGLE